MLARTKFMVQKTELFHWIIRVPKDQAAFTYFQLEANEGLSFYSTLDQSLSEAFRDIEIFAPESLGPEMKHFFKSLESEVPLLTILEEKVEDTAQAALKYSKAGKKFNRK